MVSIGEREGVREEPEGETVKKATVILSIDWDFFFSDPSDYDWSHNEEQPLFYETIWSHRAGARSIFDNEDRAVEKYVPDPQMLNGFWDRIVHVSRPTWLCESHKDAYEIFKPCGPLEIWNFDAHHDAGYGIFKCPPVPVNCGNWIQKLGKKVRCVHQVYPTWRRDHPEEKHLLSKRVKYHTHFWPDVMPLTPNLIFVCRSSCWTPSWSDDKWMEFINPLQKNAYVVGSVPFVLRVRNPTMAEAVKLSKEYDAMLKNVLKKATTA
jgi:hypothetical protein